MVRRGHVGNLLVQESFAPFGQRRASNWSAGGPSSSDWTAIAKATRHGFTFHEMLDNVGLIHMNGRVYDPNVGRFLSTDPLISDFGDSQSVNPYAYVGNRPLNHAAATGYYSKLLLVHEGCCIPSTGMLRSGLAEKSALQHTWLNGNRSSNVRRAALYRFHGAQVQMRQSDTWQE